MRHRGNGHAEDDDAAPCVGSQFCRECGPRLLGANTDAKESDCEESRVSRQCNRTGRVRFTFWCGAHSVLFVRFLMWVLDNCDVQAACSSSRYGFPEDFIVFVKRSSLLQHQDKLVRMQAKRLIVSVASQVGYPEVESHLSDVPKKIRSEIEGMLEQAPSRGAATKKVGTKPTSASGAPRRDESPQQTDSEQRLHADADADNRSRSGNNGRYSSQPLRAENADERSSMEPRSANEALHPRSQQDHRRAGARDDHSFGAPVEPSFDSGDPGAVGERWAEESGSGSVEEPFTCTFCGRQDPSFTPEELDHHYWASCPMLMVRLCAMVLMLHMALTHPHV